MKYLLLISLMFSASSLAEWTLVAEEDNYGRAYKHYISFDDIEDVKGLTYYTLLIDWPERGDEGTYSGTTTYMLRCKPFAQILLSLSYYDLPMAQGEASYARPLTTLEWSYPTHNVWPIETTLKDYCKTKGGY